MESRVRFPTEGYSIIALCSERSRHETRLERSRSARYRLRYVPGCNCGSPQDDLQDFHSVLLGNDLFHPCSEVGRFEWESIHPAQVNPVGICTVFDQQAGNVERNQR